MNIDRRRLLIGSGLASACAPLVSWGRSARAAASPPRRVVIVFSPNGPQHELGPTTGTETNFTLHPFWAPLEKYRDKAVFFREVHQAGVPFGKVDEYGHQSGSCGALTARTTEGTKTGTGPSLDRFIGQELEKAGVSTPQRALLFGLYSGARAPFFESAGQAVSPLSNPWDALALLAPSFKSDGVSVVDKALKRQHFVLDGLRADCQRLTGRLGAEGRARLGRHCAEIEALEKSVAMALGTPGGTCQAPATPISALPMNHDWLGREARDQSMDAFTELTALALACDVTRVVGIGFGNGAARFSLPASYGVPSSPKVDSGDAGPQMHAWTHRPKSDPDTEKSLRIFYNWFSERVVKLIDKLATTQDADGRPLLDTTLVLWTSEFGTGGPHSNANVPVMLFGTGDGAFKTGRQFLAQGDKAAKAMVLHQLFVSLIRHMGLAQIDSFGNAGRGPLDWLQG